MALGAHRQGEGRGDPTGSGAGVLPPQPAPAMVQERPPRCCVTQRKARLCLCSSSSSQLPGLLSGLGRQEANALLPACSPLSPQVSVTATTAGDGGNGSCLLFFPSFPAFCRRDLPTLSHPERAGTRRSCPERVLLRGSPACSSHGGCVPQGSSKKGAQGMGLVAFLARY